MKYAINGKFLSQNVTGVQRYAREILLELDKIVEKNQICIVYADDAKDIPNYENIQCVKIGNKSNLFWLEILFPFYCIFHKLISINLCNYGPMINPGIVCIHDIGIIHYPEFVTRSFYYWTLLQNRNSILKAKKLITVSNFSKTDIESFYTESKDRFIVIPNAWQHVKRIVFDDGIFEKLEGVSKNNYFFSLSSISPNKNIKWIIETARINSDEIFVVAGKTNEKLFGKTSESIPSNVKLVGYISDEEAKSLLKNAKAFLFPSFFEGFGIPPIEALACGCKNIVVSNTDCMKEIYEDYACYIDPNKPIENISNILNNKKDNKKILDKYSWANSARLLKECLDTIE